MVIPNYGVPDVSVTFALNHLVLEAADKDDRVRAGLFVSPEARTPPSTARRSPGR